MYEVFFLGTARSSESQISPRSAGIFNWIADGIARDNDGSRGWESCHDFRVVYLVATDADEVENRGKKAVSIDDAVA